MILQRTVKTNEIDKKQLIAVCDSFFCTQSHKKDRATRGVVKDVSKQKTFCPDCGSALFWTNYHSNQYLDD